MNVYLQRVDLHQLLLTNAQIVLYYQNDFTSVVIVDRFLFMANAVHTLFWQNWGKSAIGWAHIHNDLKDDMIDNNDLTHQNYWFLINFNVDLKNLPFQTSFLQ